MTNAARGLEGLWKKVTIAFLLGIILGFLVNEFGYIFQDSFRLFLNKWVSLPGDVFLRIIQMIIVPLVFTSIICGLSGALNLDRLKVLGGATLGYFLFTTIVALSIGFFADYIVAGIFNLDEHVRGIKSQVSSIDGSMLAGSLIDFKSFFLNLLPSNPLFVLSSNNMIQIVVLACMMGIALVSLREEERSILLSFTRALQEICMKIVSWAMGLAPLAVFSLSVKLMLSAVGKEMFWGLGAYIFTVLLGFFLLFIFYSIVIKFFCNKILIKFLSNIKENLLLAFSTSSSASVMPINIKTGVEKLRVNRSICEFVLPLGTTINMDGTAVYQVIATLFLARIYNVDLTEVDMILLSLLSLGASVGSPGAPGVGIVILSSILTKFGIPIEGAAILMSVDRLLDMIRTVFNVFGDLTACMFLDRYLEEP